jgi:hypothetical protein
MCLAIARKCVPAGSRSLHNIISTSRFLHGSIRSRLTHGLLYQSTYSLYQIFWVVKRELRGELVQLQLYPGILRTTEKKNSLGACHVVKMSKNHPMEVPFAVAVKGLPSAEAGRFLGVIGLFRIQIFISHPFVRSRSVFVPVGFYRVMVPRYPGTRVPRGRNLVHCTPVPSLCKTYGTLLPALCRNLPGTRVPRGRNLVHVPSLCRNLPVQKDFEF